METPTSRRNIVRGIAWTVPVIAVSATAPAFAASNRCKPIAQCKQPGEGQHTKDYAILTNCAGSVNSTITAVTIDGKPATYEADTATWIVRGFKDSRSFRKVVISFSDAPNEEYTVAFPPC